MGPSRGSQRHICILHNFSRSILCKASAVPARAPPGLRLGPPESIRRGASVAFMRLLFVLCFIYLYYAFVAVWPELGSSTGSCLNYVLLVFFLAARPGWQRVRRSRRSSARLALFLPALAEIVGAARPARLHVGKLHRGRRGPWAWGRGRGRIAWGLGQLRRGLGSSSIHLCYV